MPKRKLMELISTVLPHEGKTYEEALADHMIANGVTVQRWIPCKERMPTAKDANSEGRVFAFWKHGHITYETIGFVNDFRYHFTHWMPSPEPPKGGGG